MAQPPELAWWSNLTADALDGVLQGQSVLELLQSGLPQLLLPQQSGISSSDLYKALVLRGESVDQALIAGVDAPPHWHDPEALRFWIAPHPCGAMPVVQTPSWADFVLLVRALAHRGEPAKLVDGVHAQAVSGLIHWGLIRAFGRQSRARLIVLHDAPYGSVQASDVPGDLTEAEWLQASSNLRLEHELTHLATKRLLSQMRINLLDELIADCMGMVAALGRFHAELFGRCLATESASGRWTTYTNALSETDARLALDLVMLRACELEHHLDHRPELLLREQAMDRLRWLCQQRLDRPIQ
ncbi:hypothetical protein [Synechococcus sp. WH 8101]|uniref:DUF7005 family protein n=1 Tax=Synechococcus sp. WH 8101 TaxID=59932 RepID=UPI00102381A5|nr:hypothetical protein [Synechococcus sp. WH 8101]